MRDSAEITVHPSFTPFDKLRANGSRRVFVRGLPFVRKISLSN